MSNIISSGENFVMNTYSRFPIVLEKGDGVYVWDENGKKYIDFVAGIATNSLGHNNPKLVEAISEQAKKLIHVSNLYWTEPQVTLAKTLVENSCFDKVFFCNSGAEAVEGCLKLARKYAHKSGNKFEIISMKNSFHGRTFGAVSATGQFKYQKGLDPLLPGIKHVEYNNIDDLKNTVNENTCAIILEIIQGEGGIKVIDPEYLAYVRKICDENKIMLIFDEVQCGIGRTGSLFSFENFGIEPDVIATAKGIAGGVPMGAMLVKKEFVSAFQPGDHASTFGGNPLAASCGNVVLNELVNNNLLDNVKSVGEYLKNKLNDLKNKYSVVEDVRGIGLLQGIEVSCDPSKIISKCMENGLLLVGAGGNVIRFVPSLIITESEIDYGLQILENVLSDLGNTK